VAALPGRVYPGLIPGEGTAKGLLITGLTRDEWIIIDAFEDEAYELRRPDLTDGGHGWTYVCGDDMEAAPEGWNAEQFAVRHLATYMERFATWQTSDDNHGSPTSGQHRARACPADLVAVG
jgi:hypothetical protein